MGRAEAAARLGCCIKTIDRYTNDGLLHSRTHGRYVIFEKTQVEQLASQLT